MFFKVCYTKQTHLLSAPPKTTFQKLMEFIRYVFKKLPESFTLTYLDSDGDKVCLLNDLDLAVLIESGVEKVKLIIQETNNDFYDVTEELYIQQESPKINKPDDSMSILQSKPDLETLQSRLDSQITQRLNKMIPSITQQIKSELKIQKPIQTQQVEHDPILVHTNVKCDRCFCSPIIGIRYKCSVCYNMDLCAECESESSHEHPFLKIKNINQTPKKVITILDVEEEQEEGRPGLFSQLQSQERSKRCQKMNYIKKGAQDLVKQIRKNNQKFEQIYHQSEETAREEAQGTKKSQEHESMGPQASQFEQSSEWRQLTAANYLAETINLSFQAGMIYVKAYPTKTKEELAMIYLERH